MNWLVIILAPFEPDFLGVSSVEKIILHHAALFFSSFFSCNLLFVLKPTYLYSLDAM